MEIIDVDKIKELLQPSIVDVKGRLYRNVYLNNYYIEDKEMISHNLSLMVCLLAGVNKGEEIEKELKKVLDWIEEMLEGKSDIGYIEGIVIGVLKYKVDEIVDDLGRE